MKKTRKKSLSFWMRTLHRDIGFFLIGLTVIYCISGVVLTYRHSTYFIYEKTFEEVLAPHLSGDELARKLPIRHLRIHGEDSEKIYFRQGAYTKQSGTVEYTLYQYPTFLEKINRLHLTSNRSTKHWFTACYAVLLLFLVISSCWMFPRNPRLLYRGLFLSGAGVLLAVLLALF